jgi:hypothetical protein
MTSLPTKALGENLRIFRLCKAEHHEVAVIAAHGVRHPEPRRAIKGIGWKDGDPFRSGRTLPPVLELIKSMTSFPYIANHSDSEMVLAGVICCAPDAALVIK